MIASAVIVDEKICCLVRRAWGYASIFYGMSRVALRFCLRTVSGIAAKESIQTTNSIQSPDDLPCIAKVVLYYLNLQAV